MVKRIKMNRTRLRLAAMIGAYVCESKNAKNLLFFLITNCNLYNNNTVANRNRTN